ncbi:MAG: hypothetical protein ACRDRO_07340 [Pseudonocardiaceae bacterium]
MGSDESETQQAIGRGRVVIHVSCSMHQGSAGFANLAVRKLNGAIELDPHVTGSCVIKLNEGGACVLRDALTAWLG